MLALWKAEPCSAAGGSIQNAALSELGEPFFLVTQGSRFALTLGWFTPALSALAEDGGRRDDRALGHHPHR